jgi:hypothetical protein
MALELVKDKLDYYLKIIFGLNILLLIFVAPQFYFNPEKFSDTKDVNLFAVIAGSYWLAIMFLSIYGVYDSKYMEPLVYLQLVYKSLFVIYVVRNYEETKKREDPYLIIFYLFIVWIVMISGYIFSKTLIKYKSKSLDSKKI